MNKLKVILILTMCLGITYLYSGDLKLRTLDGVNFKFTDKLKFTLWGAGYLNVTADDDDARLHGWDLHPGFSYAIGSIGDVKVGSGAALYIVRRTPKLIGSQFLDVRPRYDLSFTFPFPLGLSFEVNHRFELRFIRQNKGLWNDSQGFRFRPRFKLSTKRFSPAKIGFWIYDELFFQDNAIPVYNEAEIGLNSVLGPVVVGVGYMLQYKPDLIDKDLDAEDWALDHRISLYLFFNVDLSK